MEKIKSKAKVTAKKAAVKPGGGDAGIITDKIIARKKRK